MQACCLPSESCASLQREVLEIEETLEKTRGQGSAPGAPGELSLQGVLARQRGRAIQSALTFLGREAERVRPYLGGAEQEGEGGVPEVAQDTGSTPPYAARLGAPHEVKAVLAMVLPDGVPVPGVPAVREALASSFLESWRALRDQTAQAQAWDVTVSTVLWCGEEQCYCCSSLYCQY